MDLVDSDGNAMSDVTIKLSGPERYRQIAKINGKETFNRLEPGDYFIIFEKKEFKFEPNKFEITLTEDRQLNIVANRFQYSAFGRLVSPSQGRGIYEYSNEYTCSRNLPFSTSDLIFESLILKSCLCGLPCGSCRSFGKMR